MLSVGMNPLKRYTSVPVPFSNFCYFFPSFSWMDGWMLCSLKKTDQFESIHFYWSHQIIWSSLRPFAILKSSFRHSVIIAIFRGGGGICNVFVQNQLIFNMRLYIDDLHFKFCINWPTFSGAFILCNLRLALINLVLTYTHNIFYEIPVSCFSFFECSIIIIII